MKDYDIDKNKLLVRLHRVQGQLSAINTMIEKDAECKDVLMQLSAATAALHSLAVLTAREHVNSDIQHAVETGTAEGAKQAMEDVTEIIDRLLRYEKAQYIVPDLHTDFHTVLHTVQENSSNPAHDAFVEKKSEFIGNICHVTTLDEAVDFVQSVKVANPKARHVAYAAICGMHGAQLCERMSDDGEPAGTAGKPILDVLRSANLTDCVVTVTRYFGGILLGSGGLARAYAKSASMAVAAAKIVDIVSCVSFACNLKYQQLRMLQHIVNQVEGAIDSENYGVDITLNISVPTYKSEEFLLLVKNAFSGSVVPEVLCRKQMVL